MFTNAMKAKSLPVSIRQAVADDLESCAVAWGNRRDTYPSIYPLRLHDPSISQTQRMQRNHTDLEQELIDTEYKSFHVATISSSDSSDKVVGFSIWQKPGAVERDMKKVQEEKSSSEKAKDADVDPECDAELAKKLKVESLEVKSKYSQGTQLWFLHMLFILPEYQRKGVGTALIEHGLALIDSSSTNADASTTIGLTSSPQGQKLYQRYGFEDVYWFRPKLQDLNEQGEMVEKEVSWPLMLRRKATMRAGF